MASFELRQKEPGGRGPAINFQRVPAGSSLPALKGHKILLEGQPHKIRARQGVNPRHLHQLPGCSIPGLIHSACLPKRLWTSHRLTRAEHFIV